MKQIANFNATVLSFFFFSASYEYLFFRGHIVLGIIVLALASLLTWLYYYPYNKLAE